MKRHDDVLTAKERIFIAAHKGNDVEAARAAGYRHPEVVATRVMARERVKKALTAKNSALIKDLARREGKQLTKVNITRNEILNILAWIARNGKSESARVSSALGLADIFRLRPKNANDSEDFTGWTDDELLAWAQRGEYPARLRRKSESGEREENIPQSSKSPIN